VEDERFCSLHYDEALRFQVKARCPRAVSLDVNCGCGGFFCRGSISLFWFLLEEMAPPARASLPAYAGLDEEPQLGWRDGENRQGSWPLDPDSVLSHKPPRAGS
jgi:hypothetical protein